MEKSNRIKILAISAVCLVCVLGIVLLLNYANGGDDIADNSEKMEKIVTQQSTEGNATEEPETEEPETEVSAVDENGMLTVGDTKFKCGYEASVDDKSVKISKKDKDVLSKYVILIDESKNRIVASKNAKKRISPASMTKILTVLVAAEQLEKNKDLSLDDTFKLTLDITDYAYINGCSVAGFKKNEKVKVKDLFYGTILPSGGDAAVALATYVAGSHEKFVDLMNEKLEELGLSDTAHFTNCVGLYDEDHYCTVYDMAMILKAAAENDFARDVLSTHVYKTTKTKKHKKGLTLSNLFLRRIEDRDTNGTVMCAKTGFVNQSGCCAASYQISNDGTPYICVTGNTYSSWRVIDDHVAIYSKFTK